MEVDAILFPVLAKDDTPEDNLVSAEGLSLSFHAPNGFIDLQ